MLQLVLKKVSNNKILNKLYVFLRLFFGRFGLWQVLIVTMFSYVASQFLAIFLISMTANLLHKDVSTVINSLSSSVQMQFVLFLLIESISIYIIWRFLKSTGKKWSDIGVKDGLSPGSMVWAIGVSLVYFASIVAVMLIINRYIPIINLEQSQEIGFDGAKTGLELALTYISLAVLPPIAEEIIFRGFLYSGARTKLSTIKAGLLVSVIFGLFHLQLGSGNPPLWSVAIDTMILSGFLVYLREKTGSIWAGVLVHALKNSLAFLFLFVLKTSGM